MKFIVKISLIFFLIFPGMLYCQKASDIQWQKCYGGKADESATAMIQTSDGGFAIVSSTNSQNGDVSGNHGAIDVWVLKLDASGRIEWQKCLGGSERDWAASIVQTSDGGYAVAATTNSIDGDVVGNHGKDTSSGYAFDAWVIKLDSSGKMLWQRCLGGTGLDEAASIIQTSSGALVVAGFTESNLEGVLNHGRRDVYVVKLADTGKILWQKCYGGTGDEEADCIIQTSDGGYAFAGITFSYDGDVSGLHAGGRADFWVVKLDSAGTIRWQKCLGGSENDWAQSIVQTHEGGFVVAGITYSNTGDVSGNHGGIDGDDAWVVSLDSLGKIQWQRSLGGSGDEWAQSIIETREGGFVIAGIASSIDGDVTGFHKGAISTNVDAWVAALSASGSLQWQKCLGGSGYDQAFSIVQTSDGGFAVAAEADSVNDGDISGNHGNSDTWLVKLAPVSSGVRNQPTSLFSLSAFPNPAANLVTLSYDLPTASSVSIEVYTITGIHMPVEGRQRSLQTAGHHEELLDLSGFAEGSYFISLSACGMTQRKMVQIVK